MVEIIIQKSKKTDKKYDAIIDNKKTVSFGAKGYSDYTLHKDSERKQRYIDRHKNNEDWSKEGIKTAGFYSRWILWNKPTLRGSINDTNNRFKNINIKLK